MVSSSTCGSSVVALRIVMPGRMMDDDPHVGVRDETVLDATTNTVQQRDNE